MERDVLLIATDEWVSGIERVRKVPAHVTLVFPEAATALPAWLLEQIEGTNPPSIASILFIEVTAAVDGAIWLNKLVVRGQLHLPIRLRFSHLLLEEFGEDDLSRELARWVVC